MIFCRRSHSSKKFRDHREFERLKFFVPQESAFFELETPVLPVFADFLSHASRVLVSILKI